MAKSAEITVAVLGGGPAGMSAALWLAQFNCKTTLIDKSPSFGGALMHSHHPNEWVLGFPGKTGQELAGHFTSHLQQYPIKTLLSENVEGIKKNGAGWEILVGFESMKFNALVLCMGMKTAGIEDLQYIEGIINPDIQSYLTCGQPLPVHIETLQGTEVVVIGGGDNAFEAALALANNGAFVHIIIRSDKIKAQSKLIQLVNDLDQSIKIYPQTKIQSISLENSYLTVKLSSNHQIKASQVFALLGYRADTKWVKQQITDIVLDKNGYICVDNGGRTSIAGLYAAGDIISGDYKSVVSSIAQGSVVAQAIQKDFQTNDT